MSAYRVCTMAIHDPETYRKCTALTPSTLARRGGRFLTRRGDTVETSEGGPVFAERMVVIEFPDRDAAPAWYPWYHSADYQSASEFRPLASTGRMILQAGRDNSVNSDPKV